MKLPLPRFVREYLSHSQRWHHYKRIRLRQRVREQQKSGAMVKVVIGSAKINFPGWILTDLPIFDALDEQIWQMVFTPSSVARVLAEHVIEHWQEDEFRTFLTIARPFIAENGFIRLAIPDGFHPDPEYIDYVKPGGSGEGSDDHKVLYDHVKMKQIFEAVGYQYRLVEYFDATGEFHAIPWDPEDGMIRRSSQHDARNQDRPLAYTSLIIDCWPN